MARVADWKIWVRLTASIWLVLVFAWTGMIAWESEVNRETAIDQARDFSRSIHEMTLAGLTGMMITGTVGQREVFLDQIKQLAAIKDLHVARSDAVIKLFGPDTKAGRSLDDIERDVMQSGKAYSEVKSDEKGNYLHVVTPALASPNYLGKNCISCHQVPEGTVLGIVSMKVSLDSVVAAVDAFRLKIAAAALGISLVLLAVVYFLTRHMVTVPLEALTHGLEDIARGEGDLTRRLPVRGDDEVGRAAKVFNDVMGNFSGLVRSVSESAQRVAAEAHSLATGATSVAQSSHLQNERSVQAASAVEQLEQSISVISQSTERVHQQSQDSLRRAEDGNRSMSQLLGDMSNVEQTVNQMAESINEFVRNTEAINKMTREVKDIAEQTNLLALNAAIEAARAGEQGRGFAVVADEVRKLAEKSAASANEIDAITATLSTQSVAVKKSITEGIEHLNSSQDSLDHVASVLSAANGSVIEVGRGLDEITRETEEQRRVSRKVVENIEAIATMAGENNQAVEQTATAAQSLESLADSLQQTVGRFKV